MAWALPRTWWRRISPLLLLPPLSPIVTEDVEDCWTLLVGGQTEGGWSQVDLEENEGARIPQTG